ncbi:DUF5683 domain-containing protein [Sphingobacterium paucimobilis]|uniref:DUF5683 domain-containing protein n=1 Tax=Sphingobacterium paucimobilis HER1398 TaxID=1346330 RepID=U2I102_9SPHI|nr:DUF5683 domain-containing protein [Sphingobacterium paucimobilis]ERJ61200.1 hypothetical protein M472_20825 [Sphingobacterium paucimobilis HER1398]
MPRLLVVIFFLLLASGTYAQIDSLQQLRDSTKLNLDTAAVQDSVKKETRKERKEREKAEKERAKYYYKDILKDSTRLAIEHVSRVAWRRSAIAPGWGQITNGGRWVWVKLPIIYGGFITAYFVFDYWNYYYQMFAKEAAYRIDNSGGTNNVDLERMSTEGIIRQKDNFRRNRDMTILVTAVWWAGNVIEAYTDSMLRNRYNIGDDLGLKISPTFMPTQTMAYKPNLTNYFTPGVKLTFTIK